MCVKVSKVLNVDGYDSSSVVICDRDSSEFSLSDDSSVPLTYEVVNVRDPELVPVLLRIPPERVSPAREGDIEDDDDPECESPSIDAELGPLRDIVEATMSVPVPEVISSTGSVVNVAVVVRPSVPVCPSVNIEVDCQLLADVRLSDPLGAVKKWRSLDVVLDVSELCVLEPLLGGGVRETSLPRLGPLDMVTGDPSPTGKDARPIPKPRPPRELRAIQSAVLKPSSRSVIELVRLRELMRLGGMTRGSACGR